jgi:hypothetical protein
MLFGVPVVAFEAGAVAETLHGGGLLLGEMGPEAVAAILARLRTEPSLRQTVLESQERAVRQIRATDFRALLLDRLAPVLSDQH